MILGKTNKKLIDKHIFLGQPNNNMLKVAIQQINKYFSLEMYTFLFEMHSFIFSFYIRIVYIHLLHIILLDQIFKMADVTWE